MAKKRRKRPADTISQDISALCNVYGVKESESEQDVLDSMFDSGGMTADEGKSKSDMDEMESCLDLLDAEQNADDRKMDSLSKVPSIASQSTKNDNDTTSDTDRHNYRSTTNLWVEPSMDKVSSKSFVRESTMQKFQERDNNMLPNIQVELLRHKLMGDISKYLLSNCPSLRMPTFERWVIDSKLEEQVKKRKMMEQRDRERQQSGRAFGTDGSSKRPKKVRKRQRNEQNVFCPLNTVLDPVLPSMVEVTDDASQRLCMEIAQASDLSGNDDSTKFHDHSSPSWKDAVKICRELCRQSNEAARQVNGLNSNLNGGTDMKDFFKGGGKRNKSSKASSRIMLEVNAEIFPDDSHGKRSKAGAEEMERKVQSNDDAKSRTVLSLVYKRKKQTKQDDGKAAKPFIVKINLCHYKKLRAMFHSVHHETTTSSAHQHDSSFNMFIPPLSNETCSPSSSYYTPATNIFHHLVFCSLLRYASLSGGQQLLDLRGGGMQGAVHSQVFDYLSSVTCQPQSPSLAIMECFASPFNVYNTHYCSMFYDDIDCHFGSSGDFFSMPLGYFARAGIVMEANPPFSPGLMLRMAHRMDEHLAYADQATNEREQCLTFMIVVPTCDVSKRRKKKLKDGDHIPLVQMLSHESFQHCLKSRFFVKHILLKSREHGMIEGSQHLRSTRYKESQYDTSIIILQSARATECELAHPIFSGPTFENGLRKAFASRHS